VRVIITPGDDIMRRFGNQIGALGDTKAHMALARAVNRVTTTVHGRVIKAIRKQSDIPLAIVRASVGRRLVKPGGSGALEGEVWAKGKPLSLKVFRARQLNFGVKARWGGEWHRYQGAFMGPRPGVIAGRLNGHVFVRTSATRARHGRRALGPINPRPLPKHGSSRSEVIHGTRPQLGPRPERHGVHRLGPRPWHRARPRCHQHRPPTGTGWLHARRPGDGVLAVDTAAPR